MDYPSCPVRAGVISTENAEVITLARAARREVIRVDDFSADCWSENRLH